MKKADVLKNRVYIECSETSRKVKATVLTHNEKEISVEMPTGFLMTLSRKNRRRVYSWRIGMLEFSSDGKLIS